MDKIFKKRPTESFDEYAFRISSLMENPDYDLTWTKVALIINEECNVDYSADKYRKTFRRTLNSLNEQPSVNTSEDNNVYYEYLEFDKESVTTNFEKGETTSSRDIALTPEQLKNPEELLKAHGYEPKDWELKTATNTKTMKKTSNGEAYVYASRIVIKPKQSPLTAIEEISKMFETFKAPKLGMPKNKFKSDDTLLIPLYDFHWGRIEEKDSDYEGFNIEEEKNRIIEHVFKYIEKFKNRQFKKIYLVIGQDFFNSSFTNFTSSQQHLQSNALEFKSMFKSGCEILINIINMFTEISNNIEVIGSIGNHAWAEEIAAFYLLEAYYRNAENVKIDSEGSVRKYIEIGNSCVGLAHADKEGDRLYGLMQIEAKDMWARTKSHVFVTGHLHHFQVNSKQGVEVYRCPSICYRDKWSVDNGYTQNEPKTMCFIFDEQEGLTETHFMYL